MFLMVNLFDWQHFESLRWVTMYMFLCRFRNAVKLTWVQSSELHFSYSFKKQKSGKQESMIESSTHTKIFGPWSRIFRHARKKKLYLTLFNYTVPKEFLTHEKFHGSTWKVSRSTMKYSVLSNFTYYREMFHSSTGICSWLFFSRSTVKSTWKISRFSCLLLMFVHA
jgi:hypothetical protein